MNWLDISILIICIASFLGGLKSGLIMQISSLVGIILGAIFVGEVAEIIHPYIHNWFNNSDNVTVPISYLAGFILIVVAVSLLGKLVDSLVKVVLLGPINKIGGAVFSMGKWILILSILLNLLVRFDINKSIITEEVRQQSYSYPVMLKIAQTIVPYLRFENYTPSSHPEQDHPLLQSITI